MKPIYAIAQFKPEKFEGLDAKTFFSRALKLPISQMCCLLNFILSLSENPNNPDCAIARIYPNDLVQDSGMSFLKCTFLVRCIVARLSKEDKSFVGDHLYDWVMLHDDKCSKERARRVFEVLFNFFDCCTEYPKEKVEELILLQRFKDASFSDDIQTIGFIQRWLHMSYLTAVYPGPYKDWMQKIQGNPQKKILNAIRSLKSNIISGVDLSKHTYPEFGTDIFLAMINVYGHAEAV